MRTILALPFVVALTALAACSTDSDATASDTAVARDTQQAAADIPELPDVQVVAETSPPSDTFTVVDAPASDAGPEISAPKDVVTDAADVVVPDVVSPDVVAPDVAAPDTAPDAVITDTGPDVSGPLTCSITGFDLMAQAVESAVEDGDGFVAWNGANGTQVPFDRMTLELLGVPYGPFDFVFSGENYKTCDVCLTIATACTADGCDRQFLVASGDLSVTNWPAPGGQFTGTVSGIRAVEVTIGPDFVSQVVPGGDVWCIDQVALDATVTPL